MFPSFWTRRQAPWAALGVSGVLLAAALAVVDLSPKVEGDFFFARDDPQLEASREIDETFPSAPQIIVRVEAVSGEESDGDGTAAPGGGPAGTAAYREQVRRLTEALQEVDGVRRVYSVTTEDPRRSPLFRRVLLTGEDGVSNVVLETDGTDGEVLLPRLEEAVAPARQEGLDVVLSGEPVIVELIRRSLFRDLVVFGLAALLVFGVLVAGIYRDVGIMVGTLATCLASVAGTLLVVRVMGVAIGLLTANLITIVFVLTLSHVVFLTANWRGAAGRGHAAAVEQAAARDDRGAGGDDQGTGGSQGAQEVGRDERRSAVVAGVRDTLEGSFWSMATTFLGFSSLLVASAQPLRELGVAGAVGTLVAMTAAYGLYPAFLGWASSGRASSGPVATGAHDDAAVGGRAARLPGWAMAAVVAVVLGLGTGIARLDTDPSLLSYFRPGSDLREGLELIDRDGGSAGLAVVVRDADGGRLDEPAVYEKMSAYQAALEADSAVGVVLSPAVLLDHARAQPLARFLTLEILLDLAMSPQLGEVGLGFVTRDRERGLYSLRMRESVTADSRRETADRLLAAARDAGLEPEQVGGLYVLQGELGRLIASSLRLGIGGLLILFLGIGWVVSRGWRTAGVMLACLTGVPLVVLGTFGHAGIAVDIITSPAANVALAMGVDSMIHLVVRVRRLSGGLAGDAPGGLATASSPTWAMALRQIRTPVLVASGIICAGFGIFVLSAFPPTQRFGLAVILGTVTSATMAVVALPWFATLRGGILRGS